MSLGTLLPPPLAEVPYPRIDPVAFRIFDFDVRWYGISYIVAFALAAWVLIDLSKRGRWPVRPDRVLDVLFWGILGVMVGGRVGHMLLYADDKSLREWVNVRQGGMAFHGGLAGVVLAYVIYCRKTKTRFRDFGDGLALATPLGIAVVRVANFINAELVGRAWDGPFAMQFPGHPVDSIHGGPPVLPGYRIGVPWDGRYETTRLGERVLRHPSQLYQAVGEGLLVYLILRWLMLRRGWGGGRIGAMFLVLYGAFRFVAEWVREPEDGYGHFGMTMGQELCAWMVVAGLAWLLALRIMKSRPMEPIDWSKAPVDGESPGAEESVHG